MPVAGDETELGDRSRELLDDRHRPRLAERGDARGFRRDEVTKRRPDGSTYKAQRSVRISRKTGKEI